MRTVQAIEKRSDVSPEEGKGKYGDVNFADEKNKKYPIDTEAHIRAAWNYINKSANAAKYSADDVKSIKRKIIAAWKRKIDKGGPPSANGDKAEAMLVQCDIGYSIALVDDEPPSEIMYMPIGRQQINPLINGKPAQEPIEVEVDSSVVDTLQADLDARLAKEPRPYGDFNHESKGASFLPKKFLWRDGEGLFLAVDWTASGRNAVKGRDYSYFSPSFNYADGKVVGLPKVGPIGALTNQPAFEQIKRIAASAVTDPNDDDDPDDDKETMTKVATKLIEFELIQAEQCEDDEAVVAAVVALRTELQAVQASNAGLRQENADLKLEAERIKGQEAETIVQAAIAEGKIGSQDKDSISFWRAQLVSSPTATKKVLARMPINPVLKKVINVNAGDSKANMTDGRTKAKMVADMHNAVNEIMAANPKMGYTDAWNKAKREHAELFIEA